jgi:hypothetical protein
VCTVDGDQDVCGGPIRLHHSCYISCGDRPRPPRRPADFDQQDRDDHLRNHPVCGSTRTSATSATRRRAYCAGPASFASTATATEHVISVARWR